MQCAALRCAVPWLAARAAAGSRPAGRPACQCASATFAEPALPALPPCPCLLCSARPACLPAVTTEEAEVEAAAPGGVTVPPSRSLECGRALWCDFFSVAPATTTAPSTSLDFIAP